VEWRSLDISGADGRIGNTFLTQGARRIAVVFPGFLGGWNTPATYYPVLALLDRGYDALCLDSVYREHPTVERLRHDASTALRAALEAGTYEESLVMGKSLGTIAVAELLLDAELPPAARSVWLTPLLRNDRVESAIAMLESPALFVIGTKDPLFDRTVLQRLQKHGHHVAVVQRANHGLAIDGDAAASAKVAGRLVETVHRYLDGRAS
jgi:dienelactone hydrolase